MRRLAFISVDLLFVALATIVAIMLRGYFDTVSESLIALMPYGVISLTCASVMFFLGGVDRTPWRYNSVADHLQLIVLTAMAILLALVVTFALNRLAPVARSLPVLQGGLIVSILITARSAARFWHIRQIHISRGGCVNEKTHETVLVVGVNTVTELFLLSVKEFAAQQLQVAGIVTEEPSMRGRTIQQKPVVGTVEELRDILESLEVHGASVNRIVVATPADRLQRRSLEILSEIENSSDVIVQFLSERLGFEGVSQKESGASGQARVAPVRNVIPAHYTNSGRRSLRLEKRIADVLGAALLVFALTPVTILVAFIVGLDVGFPLIFWQQRPGLGGRPFKLYKFRTMRAAHDKHRVRIPDEQRSSVIGQILRRTRLDELPQLYNVLIGDMSLIGPRPLLPCDQAPEYAARLSVRPGITGWAQVNGGRIISSSDKCILDIWYAQNASFVLDVKIVLSTAKMILFGDQINTEAVNQARSDLGLKRLLRTTMVPAE